MGRIGDEMKNDKEYDAYSVSALRAMYSKDRAIDEEKLAHWLLQYAKWHRKEGK